MLNSEPGRVSGNVVTGRKGGVFMAFRVTGKAAHSGANFADGNRWILKCIRGVLVARRRQCGVGRNAATSSFRHVGGR